MRMQRRRNAFVRCVAGKALVFFEGRGGLGRTVGGFGKEMAGDPAKQRDKRAGSWYSWDSSE